MPERLATRRAYLRMRRLRLRSFNRKLPIAGWFHLAWLQALTVQLDL